jgi:hypothetical protein
VYELKRREKITNYVHDLLGNEKEDEEEIGLFQGIEDKDRVNMIFE